MKDYICEIFAQNVGLSIAEIFENDLTLSAIIARSDHLHNSIDLMEIFAKTANMLKKQYGVQIRLPAFSLDTPISDVLEAFLNEADKVNTLT
ncbi:MULTISPECIES: hypothetical protein [unclassified Nostoc]|uniref:hypothetical protein n=1 Tax=unclassified Nostoc TaxID=2593658 RepID=UPI0013D5A2BC|nr:MULTISPECIES: hypothetical protein [unclassified Nostoc]MBD2521390.1 hypothetical protein [Nostoc sp. FACHB-133]MBE8997943.1 hypothetical protein [Nostoc sp. LEGE 12447]NEU82066.1 hypothetical protein [Nostoc sp. UIC 10630]